MEVSVRLRYLHQDKGKKVCEPLKMKQFSCYSKSNAYLHAKLPILSTQKDLRDNNKDRPRLLTDRDKRSILRAIGGRHRQEHFRLHCATLSKQTWIQVSTISS